MTNVTYPPIILPPPEHPSWQRAAQIAATLRAKGKANPFIVAAIVNGLAESAWTAVVEGDNDKSFGPWQINWSYSGEPILKATGIDIRAEPDLAKHVDALLWLLSTPPYAKTLAGLNSSRTGEEATAVFVLDFERAGAAGALERRVAIAPAIETWLARLN